MELSDSKTNETGQRPSSNSGYFTLMFKFLLWRGAVDESCLKELGWN